MCHSGANPTPFVPRAVPAQPGNQEQAQAAGAQTPPRGTQPPAFPAGSPGQRAGPSPSRVHWTRQQTLSAPGTGREHRPGQAGPHPYSPRDALRPGGQGHTGRESWNVLQKWRSCISARPEEWQSRGGSEHPPPSRSRPPRPPGNRAADSEAAAAEGHGAAGAGWQVW